MRPLARPSHNVFSLTRTLFAISGSNSRSTPSPGLKCATVASSRIGWVPIVNRRATRFAGCSFSGALVDMKHPFKTRLVISPRHKNPDGKTIISALSSHLKRELACRSSPSGQPLALPSRTVWSFFCIAPPPTLFPFGALLICIGSPRRPFTTCLRSRQFG